MSRYREHQSSKQNAKAVEIISKTITHAHIFGKCQFQVPITNEQARQLAHFAKQGVKVRLK